jgi:hypothetical protein
MQNEPMEVTMRRILLGALACGLVAAGLGASGCAVRAVYADPEPVYYAPPPPPPVPVVSFGVGIAPPPVVFVGPRLFWPRAYYGRYYVRGRYWR